MRRALGSGTLSRVRLWLRWGILLTVVTAAGGGAWFGLADDESEHFGADVGLTSHTSCSAPQDGCRWVRSQGDDPADWASSGE
jgi:hypothetical protein